MAGRPSDEIQSGHVFGHKWKIDSLIGKGTFGDIFSCECENEECKKGYAVKVEPRTLQSWIWKNEHEFLLQLKNVDGFPQVMEFGYEGTWAWTVMTLLGPSLEMMFRYCDRRFSLSTVVKIGDQLLTRIEEVHNHGILHRDIKPDNLLVGYEKTKSIIHLLDFGLSQYFHKKGEHIPPTNRSNSNVSLVGTPKYASLNNHRGLQQSRRDDMESFCYNLLYFSQGYLPWEHVSGRNHLSRFYNIYRIKADTPNSVMFAECHPAFLRIYEHVRSLNFKDQPDYALIRQLLWQALPNECRDRVKIFDWELKINSAP